MRCQANLAQYLRQAMPSSLIHAVYNNGSLLFVKKPLETGARLEADSTELTSKERCASESRVGGWSRSTSAR